jgi:23S rRNA (cytidine1920-2'-O)/16S rRNA (cytidine1409-2'-O)-methyltransferase
MNNRSVMERFLFCGANFSTLSCKMLCKSLEVSPQVVHRELVLHSALAGVRFFCFDERSQHPFGDRTLKTRLDKLLHMRGLVSSRERAQSLILAGKVLVDGQKVEKAGAGVDDAADLRLLDHDLKYVSRGGLKLEKAIAHWRIEVAGRVCLDVGASTGGFTDCLLQHGAARVIAIDTGYGQIDYRLRQDARVRLMEKTNARYLSRHRLGETTSLIVMDVSFISATLVLPAVIAAAFPENPAEHSDRQIVVLVKPQFEAGREHVGKGGIVRDVSVQAAAVEKVRQALIDLGCKQADGIESPILGGEGNREFLLYATF